MMEEYGTRTVVLTVNTSLPVVRGLLLQKLFVIIATATIYLIPIASRKAQTTIRLLSKSY